MDDSEDENWCLTKPQTFRSKPLIRNPNLYPMNTHYSNDVGYLQQQEEEDDDELEDEEQNPQFQNPQSSSGYYYSNNNQSYYENEPKKRTKKKRKLETLLPNSDLDPRSGLNPPKSSNLGGGSSRDSWSEGESFELLEFWGERYLELGRRSLRAEDWVEVAEKMSNENGRERNEMECRNQMDVLKKKYKKEREKMEKMGGGFLSKWVFFKKMDGLLNLRMRGYCGLGCGVDSGEYVFMNPRVYLDKSNGLDEMRDSPGVSDEENEEEDEGLGRGEEDGDEEEDGESARLLADSIQRFGMIYEKIESSKRRQMMELEKMRRDFQRDLELQKEQIVERAQVEIAKLREGDEEEEDDDEEDDDDDDDDNDGDDANIRV